MIARLRSGPIGGSGRWSLWVAEITAWGTAVVVFVLLHVADLERATYAAGMALVGLLVLWLAVLFRVLIPRLGGPPWIPWASLTVHIAFASAAYGLLRADVGSAQLVFVPVVMSTGLSTSFPVGLVAAAAATGAYWGIAGVGGGAPDAAGALLTAAVFALTGSVAGLLAGELRTHYRAEQEEHRLATAVRLRLTAVLDAVDEAIVFRDRNGIVRLVNQRAQELFAVDADSHLGRPVVELLRTIARQTEDPEGFMETFQELRDDPELELRVWVEQIIPARRQLRLHSGPTMDEGGTLVGRIDVFTDVTESVRRAGEIERLYEQARAIAESFQRSLLPQSTPSLPRHSLVAHYVPASGRRSVCGDFYDFVPLPEGRMGFVLGDVVGAGPPAAADAALVRYTLRSFASEVFTPDRLLRWMNTYLSSQFTNDRFARVVFAVLDPERAVLQYASAGHVPPILYRASARRAEWLEEGGIALGVERDADYKLGRVELEPGDMLVLYTDGVTDAWRNGRPFGRGRLGDIVTQYGVGTPGELVQAVRRAVEAWVTPEGMRDDVALLVSQVAPDTALAEPVRELVLPNEPARIADIRSFVRAFLADVRAPVEASYEMLLAVGEAAGNAARHGRSTGGRSEVRVRCSLDGPDVVVTVADDGPGFDLATVDGDELPDRFASGGRGLFLMRQFVSELDISSSADGTTVTLRRRVGWPGRDT